jgi:hypothetical protein
MITINLKTFDVLSTGVDGGHHYISSEIEFNGIRRKITVLFKNRSNEELLKHRHEITVRGILFDEGDDQRLLMSESEIIE